MGMVHQRALDMPKNALLIAAIFLSSHGQKYKQQQQQQEQQQQQLHRICCVSSSGQPELFSSVIAFLLRQMMNLSY